MRPIRLLFSLIEQTFLRVHGLIDGRVNVRPVNVLHIQVISAQVLQATIDGGENNTTRLSLPLDRSG